MLENSFEGEVSSLTNSTLEGAIPLSVNSNRPTKPQYNTRSSTRLNKSIKSKRCSVGIY